MWLQVLGEVEGYKHSGAFVEIYSDCVLLIVAYEPKFHDQSINAKFNDIE